MGTSHIPYSWRDLLEKYSPLIVGILNITPDSFSDGGEYLEDNDAREHIEMLFREGAHVVDVGAESTRRFAHEVNSADQLKRLNGIYSDIALSVQKGKLFSIDTRNAEVAYDAVQHGFQIINDISAGRFDEKMFEVIATTGALCVLMHSRGTPETMTTLTQYENIIDDVCQELLICISRAEHAGIRREKIMVDPGIGFAKTPEQGIKLLENIDTIKMRLDSPVMVGVSRKTITSYMMTGNPHSVPFKERDAISATLAGVLANRGVDALRVHNVELTRSVVE